MAIMNDGFNIRMVFPGAGLTFIELELTPPAFDGRGEIDNTGMRNVKFTTAVPKFLITLGKTMAKVKWDPFVYAAAAFQIQLNRNQQIQILFPSLTNAPARTLTFFGWMSKFTPETFKEGELPKADIEITASNQTGTPVPDGNEIAPTLV